MHVVRCGQAKQSLQVNLARSGSQQVGTAHDMRDALECIVHHHRQLISEQTIGALHHEIADLVFEMLGDAALQRIVEFNYSTSTQRIVIPAQAGIQRVEE